MAKLLLLDSKPDEHIILMAYFCYNTKVFDIQRYMEPAQSILERIPMSINEGSGESAQTRRLARAFVARMHKVWMKMKTLTKF